MAKAPLPKLLIFDDGGGAWGPLTDLRAIMELRTGATKTRLRIERVLQRPVSALWLSGWSGGSSPLEAIEIQRHPGSQSGALPTDEGHWLLVNSRWIGTQYVDQVRVLPAGSALLQPNGQIVAAAVNVEQREQLLGQLNMVGQRPEVNDLMIERLPQRALIERPWHIIEGLEAALRADLEASTLPLFDSQTYPGVSIIGDAPVRVGPEVKIAPMVVLNAMNGPIVLDHGAMIGPMAVLEGPCYLGPGSSVAPHTNLRRNTSIGPCCSVGGEISHSILHGFSNKAHTGYLGHALVGKWVNLGADTNVSNLKNTYGHVRVQLSANSAAEDSGLEKLGPIIGDYVRTAIGSRLMTGSCLGTGSMLAVSGFAPKFLDRFTFLTDTGAAPYRETEFLATARTMMTRRDQPMMPAEEQRLRDLIQQSTSMRV